MTGFGEAQQMVRETAARFARETLAHNAGRLDRHEGAEAYVENLRELARLGFNGIALPAELGGAGAGSVAYALAMFELGKVCASTAIAVSINNMVAEIVDAIGTDAQRRKYIPPLLGGEWPAASFCLTESGAGSDPAAMRTTATRDGGQYVLNGVKQWITSGPIAGFYVLWAVTDPDAPKGRGISCFIVERDTRGVSTGPPVDKMGQHGSPTCEVILDEARIPASNLLGSPNDGFRIAMRELSGGRIGVGAMANGIATEALALARAHMLEREQHGKRLADHQGLQWMVAERAAELEAAFWLLMRAAALREAGKPHAKEASMAKLVATETGERATRDALQVFGGYGYMREFPLERYCRDIRIASIYEGTTEIQKTIVFRELLRELE